VVCLSILCEKYKNQGNNFCITNTNIMFMLPFFINEEMIGIIAPSFIGGKFGGG